MPAIITATDLDVSTDAQLDAALTRLYAIHAEADVAGKAAVHVEIMAVLGAMSVRLDAWLAAR